MRCAPDSCRRPLSDLVVAAWRRLTLLDRYVQGLDREFGLLHGISMLQPLPLPAIEQLARGLEPVQVSAGQVVFRQGDQADRYYVIESGAAEVIGDGRLVTTLGPGTGSERSLCCARSHVPPRFRRPTCLAPLTSDRFLPVVTGFPPSASRAATSVEKMLDRFGPADRAQIAG